MTPFRARPCPFGACVRLPALFAAAVGLNAGILWPPREHLLFDAAVGAQLLGDGLDPTTTLDLTFLF